ncbi:MAG: Na(+)-translocating NADH-quinone reductase subunit A [Rikenellaceae bacterium]
MTKVVKLKKGLDISLVGRAEKVLEPLKESGIYALIPDDFHGVTPKMLVQVGDKVKAGSAVFFDKYRPNLIFTSPVSGTVEAVNRGEKRKIMSITITTDRNHDYERFEVSGFAKMSPEQIKAQMLAAGLWPMIIQRPYGIIADEKDTPRSIHISLFDSAPLGVDMNYILENSADDFAKGIEVLNKLTNGGIHFGASPATSSQVMTIAGNVGEVTIFEGKHPAGLVGVQINNTHPINKGEVVWTIDAQNVAIIGRFFENGIVDMTRIVATCGSEVEKPHYHRIIMGASVASILGNNIKPQADGGKVRIISGNVLTGIKTSKDGYLSFYNNQLTVIPEGDKYEFLGWIAPRPNKFSFSKSYFSWLTPGKSYRLDTNTNGDERAYVMTGQYEEVFPMDIYPVYLIKAILAKDIDKMENLGIYEVTEEDFALCEFVCTSKIPVQKIIREGIDLMIKELN